MQKYYLAVDGGGTKTDALCSDQHGVILGHGQSGATNLTSTSVGAASFNLLEAIRQAVEKLPQDVIIQNLVMGLAGLDTDLEHETAHRVFKDALSYYKIENFVLINDSLIALENGSNNPNALVLISGTGSISYGRNQAGESARVSGMDFLLTDQGSGYYIGRQTLREAVKSYDGRSAKSILEDLVCQHFAIKDMKELKNSVYNPLLTKSEVAELSKVCFEAHGQGDAMAQEILDHAVAELFLQVTTIIHRLRLNESQFDCVFSGSILQNDYISKQLIEKITINYSSANFVFPKSDPVYGALKLALIA